MSKNKPSHLLVEMYKTALDFYSCGLFSDEKLRHNTIISSTICYAKILMKLKDE